MCYSLKMEAQEDTSLEHDDRDISIGIILGPNLSWTYEYKGVHENVPMIGLVSGLRINKKVSTAFSISADLLYSRNVYRFADIRFYKKRFEYLILPIGIEYQINKLFCSIGPSINYMLSGQAIYTEREEFIDISDSFTQLSIGYFFRLGYNLVDYKNNLRLETEIKKMDHIYSADLKFILTF